MARKTVIVSDLSGTEIPEGKGAIVSIKYNDARLGQFEAHLTEEEAKKLSDNARKVGRRGRRPRVAVAA